MANRPPTPGPTRPAALPAPAPKECTDFFENNQARAPIMGVQGGAAPLLARKRKKERKKPLLILLLLVVAVHVHAVVVVNRLIHLP